MPIVHHTDVRRDKCGGYEEYVNHTLLPNYLADHFCGGASGALERLERIINGHLSLQAELIHILYKKGVLSLQEVKDAIGHESRHILEIDNEWHYPAGSNG